jgi:hypothetical protein
MIRLRPWSVFVFAVLFVPALHAQDKKPSPWVVDRSLTVSPQGPPVPSLKYRLLPLTSELKDGNAVPIYLRLVHEQNDAARKYLAEAPLPWNKLPIDKLPMDEVRKYFKRWHYTIRELEAGARRRSAEWNYTLDVGDPIGILLPDAQQMRNYVPMVTLQARVALAEGDFTAAAHHLETGFAMSRQVAEGPFFINGMVAFALAAQFSNTVVDFIERPEAPNLYWALTALPRPLINIGRERDVEFRMLEMAFPELADLDRLRPAEAWDGILKQIRTDMHGLSLIGESHILPDWYPKQYLPEEPPAKSPDLAAARKFVATTKGLPAERVEAMPAAQVLLMYLIHTYHVKRDDWYRATYLPYPQAVRFFDDADRKLKGPLTSEGEMLGHILLPAIGNVYSVQMRIERTLAALRVIEALRMHAAAHDRKLPDKLDDITEVPVPDDPGTGKPFEYSRDGDTATVSGAKIGPRANGVRFQVTIRKK